MTLFCRQIRSREAKNVQKAKQQVYRLTIKYTYNHVTFRRRKKDHDGGRVYWRARSQCKVGLTDQRHFPAFISGLNIS